ncbi:MAG TPA: acetyl-CoA hydrolase/transferase C-terminal domain-containing protein [Syntrophomonadaceae bacterium]|nr:acetyl-CoA hydrolase/transferase C-terminal domain-containing protein [Syntrophomonadaceae bacterium]HNX29588.1 acetyl-CoA hydrolase/transferase C-terminal domain-containing protein [Syntrophomonadaceae bacterium]HPR94063.1 acetyl-CoA hydrolase/transferase C-terminal domain-containing protein [Syntrophomonadaceae bacterium]
MQRWKEMYKQKLTSPDEAAKLVKNGDMIVSPLSNGQPLALINAVAQRIKNEENLRDISFISGVDVRWFDLYHPDLVGKVVIDSGFVGPVLRDFVGKGLFTYTPVRLGESVDMVNKCRQCDIVGLVVAPMDKHGFFSTGTNCDWGWETSKSEKIRHVVLEVNENMPRTFGTNQIHISEVDLIVENNIPLVCLPDIPVNEKDEAIGRYIADMVEDGSCIQIGIGGMPNAVANFLRDKKDLSVHSEMLADSMVDLYYAGVITSARKNFMPYKWIATFALGSQKLYDFMDDNPLIEMHTTRFVNDPCIIGNNDKMISVNSTLEVDLTGQCASESISFRQYTGTGGQLDFVQGTWRSKGGKSFLTLYSTYTDKEGNLQSKIKPILSNGIFTTVSRTDVQYVVTEYGVAFLKGQNLRTRVRELVSIAHPDFRDELLFEAKRLNFIP